MIIEVNNLYNKDILQSKIELEKNSLIIKDIKL